MEMEKLIAAKVDLLTTLGIRLTEEQKYALYSCKNEIQLDNCARRIISMSDSKSNKEVKNNSKWANTCLN